MHVVVVTTFNAAGYEQYARRSIKTFLKHWPGNVRMVAYVDEGPEVVDIRHNRLTVHKHDWLPLIEFKTTHKNTPSMNGDRGQGRYDYRFDAVKFCHKPFALARFMTVDNANMDPPADKVIWLDADTVTHSPIPWPVVERMCPKRVHFSYLGRNYKYSECGFMVFDAVKALGFIKAVAKLYTSGAFKSEREWHDSYLFDQVRKVQELTGLKTLNMTPELHRRNGGGHPFVNSFLGEYMDHLKGPRKITGKPKKGDMLVGHRAAYWKDNAK